MVRAPAVLGVSLVVVGALGACTDETTFNAEEQDILKTFQLPTNPPANRIEPRRRQPRRRAARQEDLLRSPPSRASSAP